MIKQDEKGKEEPFYYARQKLRWAWNSPTLMTWASFLTRSLSLLIVLPLILNRLSIEEIALWYLFSAIIGLQGLADVGFSPTFSRLIAYGMGGISSFRLREIRDSKQVLGSGQPNWAMIGKVCCTMRIVYTRLAIISTILTGFFGTWVLVKPITAIQDSNSGWLAWTIILVTSLSALLGNTYSAYLQGVNHVALLRRWETITSLSMIGTSLLVLLLGGKILELVIANQVWAVLNVLRNRWLCLQVENGRFRKFKYKRIEPIIFDTAWASAWRSGLGVFMSYGLVQISGLMYAQVATSASVASYLLALRLIQTINQFSQAPFYSKLPTLSRLHSEGSLSQQVDLAKKGMILAYWTYVIGFISLGLLASPLLKLLGSNAEFVSPVLWSIMGLGIFAERYGAMHINLYSTTNHIIWHIANGVSGIIYLLVSIGLFKYIGVYTFPIALLISYLGFYCWYSAKHSYRAFGLSFWQFEPKVMFAPALCITVYSLISSFAV